MFGPIKSLITVLLFVLLTSAVGGFFIYNSRPTADVEVERKLVIRESPPVEEVIKSEDFSGEPEDSGLRYIASEIERVAKESAELAVQTKRFIQSSQVKGIYLNEFIADSQTPFAKASRENIKKMLDETELNGVVIDIKENTGPNLPSSLKIFIEELHQKDVWVIARICVFRDSSLREKKPEWYLKDSTATSAATIWKDT